MTEISSQAARSEILLDTARMLSRAQDMEELLDFILARSRDVMDCEVCSILLPEEKNGDLRIRSTLDPINAAPVLVPKGKGIAGEVYQSQEVVNIKDALKDPRHFTPAADKSGLVTHAMLTIPLLEGDRCLGVMQAINPNRAAFFEKEDESIFETFGSLIAVTLMRLDVQQRAIREAQHRQQMASATEIQRSFLPPPRKTIGDIRVEAFYEPASEIGGDFYFWHEPERQETLLGIGDVCGKGLPAALDMARGTTMIASLAHSVSAVGLGKWVSALNSRLCDVMSAGRFIAANFVLIDQARRRVHLVVAGLPAPKVFTGTRWLDVEAAGNPPLGIACGLDYRQTELPLCAGRTWLIFSDGLLELQNKAGEHFEDRAFMRSLDRIAGMNSGAIIGELAKDWKTYSDDSSYQDDATIIAIRDDAPAPPREFEFTCKPDTLKEARDFIESWALYCGFDDENVGLIVLGCDEVFNNICRHAYCSTEGPATCLVEVREEALAISVRHTGEGIRNEDIASLAKDPSPDRIGGMGLHVVLEVFDHTDFTTDGKESHIKLLKTLR